MFTKDKKYLVVTIIYETALEAMAKTYALSYPRNVYKLHMIKNVILYLVNMLWEIHI